MKKSPPRMRGDEACDPPVSDGRSRTPDYNQASESNRVNLEHEDHGTVPP